MSATDNLVVSPLSASSQLIDPQTGIPTAYGQRALGRMIQAINGALTILGQFNGVIGTAATVEGQAGTVAAKVQHLGPTGNLNALNLHGHRTGRATSRGYSVSAGSRSASGWRGKQHTRQRGAGAHHVI